MGMGIKLKIFLSFQMYSCICYFHAYVYTFSSLVLEKNVHLLMDNVESLQVETYRLLGYEKNIAKQAQQKQQFLQRRVSL